MTSRLEISETVVSAQLDDEMVLLDAERGIYYGLDPVGTRIWQLLDAGHDAEEIIEHLTAEYDADPGLLRADVAAFLAQLTAQGLIRHLDG
ncbi:MAG: PqqD family protein [Chloroflexi bacterium]|nr:PqqD family protein [Chloroflexota bacterium]